MIKHSRLKVLLLILSLFPILGASQALEHVQGEILFKLLTPNQIEDFKREITITYPDHISDNSFIQVSSAFDIWKLSFDQNEINEITFLAEVRKNHYIEAAQFNFFTANRTIPNDPLFSGLWYLRNIGQTDGLPGVDLDAVNAWSTATGGITMLGDTIVICVIDEKFDYNHIDLHENIWVNHEEVPDDGIDNDNNGYVDDYLGWNVDTSNDEIENTGPNDWHGTAVAGVVGAVGDNNIGVTGVCWNVKLMLVSRGNTAADAIAAYTYPYESRKRYNQTEGASGAFVVSTNASWGIDFGTPDDAPLWCAMYDSLGSVGILNAAATINSNVDVDIVGDLPTTCSSDFLITTTSVDHNDFRMNSGGYGAQSIDLGAFGFNILSTINGNSYEEINGTSAAAPQVSGTIGLLHAAPCPDFATLAKYDPPTAALQLKNYILEGVESNSSLNGITVTGGRLNMNNSLGLLMNDCDYAGCYSPFSVHFEQEDTSSIIVEWQNSEVTDFEHFQYKLYGSSSWITLNNVSSPLTIDGLSSCTIYEYRFRTFCVAGSDLYSEVSIFETDGCCYPPEEFYFESTDNEIYIEWNPITTATGYVLKYRTEGAPSWETASLVTNAFYIDGLSECQTYEFKIKSICPNIQGAYSTIKSFSTIGCDACLEFEYCESSGGIGSLTWINTISLSDLQHESGESMNGYSDFTEHTANLVQGFIHDISITMDYELFQFPSYFSVWIDLNHNGVFGENELLHQSWEPEVFTNGTLIIPADALLGSTRMRIALQDEIIGPCGISSLYGEVEDYCVYISEPTECLPPVNFNTSLSGNNAILTWSGNLLIDKYILNYREVGSEDWIIFSDITANNFIITELSPCTDYEYFLSSICDGEPSSVAPMQFFTSLGCGACLDESYCGTQNCQSDFEWIEQVTFNGLQNHSGPNDGYQLFSDFNANLFLGENYFLEILPGFANDTSIEFFTVWIDYNLDGAFNNTNEKVIEGYSHSGEAVSGNIYIPNDAAIGSSRIKISMKQAGLSTGPCEDGFDGEIEEYCINILASEESFCSKSQIESLLIIDTSTVNVVIENNPDAISYRIRYRPSNSTNDPWKSITSVNTNLVVNDILSCEDYDFQVQSICALGLSNFGEVYKVNTCYLTSADESYEEEPKIKIFPNPFSGTTNLHINLEGEQNLRINIYSNLGTLVQTKNIDAKSGKNSIELEMENLASGIYFLNIISNKTPLATLQLLHQAP